MNTYKVKFNLEGNWMIELEARNMIECLNSFSELYPDIYEKGEILEVKKVDDTL